MIYALNFQLQISETHSCIQISLFPDSFSLKRQPFGPDIAKMLCGNCGYDSFSGA